MEIKHFNNVLSTDEGNIGLIVADNICSTFVYPEFLLRHYSQLKCINDDCIRDILDVGCGAGPFGVYFGLHGKRVDGIDINPIAVECCRLNIEKYNLRNNFRVMLAGIQAFTSGKRYDLIICNPPLGHDSYMRKEVSFDYYRIKEKVSDGIIDAETEDYLTNCWRDERGKDMIDYIFERSEHLLRQNGKILIVCGDDFIDGTDFICSKASSYPHLSICHCQKYKEHLHLEDIDEVYDCDKTYNIVALEYISD